MYFYGSTKDPMAGAILVPGTFFETNLEKKDQHEMLHTKYQSSGPRGS